MAGVKEAGENKALPGRATRRTTLTRPLLSAVVSDVPDIPEVVSEQGGAAMPRRHARHALVGVEAQDVFEDDTGVAETPRRLVGGSDGGHGHVGIQAFGQDSGSFATHGARRYACRDEVRHGTRTGTLRAADDETREEKTMKKSDIAVRVACQASLSKVAVNAVFEAVGDALAKGDKVTVSGFGTFAPRSRAARTGRNPRTGESVAIAESRAPAFEAGKALRDGLRQGPGGQGGTL